MKKELWQILFEALYDMNEIEAFNSVFDLDVSCVTRFENYLHKIRKEYPFDMTHNVKLALTKFLFDSKFSFNMIVNKWGNIPVTQHKDAYYFTKTCKNLSDYCDELINKVGRNEFDWIY